MSKNNDIAYIFREDEDLTTIKVALKLIGITSDIMSLGDPDIEGLHFYRDRKYCSFFMKYSCFSSEIKSGKIETYRDFGDFIEAILK